MDVIQQAFKRQFALVYLYDIMIFFNSVSDLFCHLPSVLGLLSDVGESLKLKKCFFIANKADYFGQVIKPGKLTISTSKLMSFADWSSRQTWQNWSLKSFFGLWIVFCRLVPNFVQISAPPYKEVMKNQPFHFDGLYESDMQMLITLQEMHLSQSLLALQRTKERFI